MPYVRISLLRGKSEEYLAQLSRNVHRAMVETFDTPPTDRFQVIQQCEPHELIYDRDYLCGPRSDGYVLICITAGKPRPASAKQALYRRLCELLANAPGVRPEDVMVVITTTATEDWSFGKGMAANQPTPA